MPLKTQTSDPDVAAMRCDYTLGVLDESNLAVDWLTQFRQWFAEAQDANLVEPNAMVFATATAEGVPSARSVLLKALDERGFVLFTNYRSRKGSEVTENPFGSLVFPWFALQRQVIVAGSVERISREESAAYFHSRPRGAQLGAWASPQSNVISSRDILVEELTRAADQYPEDMEIPLPEHWGGLRIKPETVEFWQGRADRLHDRLRYRNTQADEWIIERLAP